MRFLGTSISTPRSSPSTHEPVIRMSEPVFAAPADHLRLHENAADAAVFAPAAGRPARAHREPPRDGALEGATRSRFVALEELEAHVPVEARGEILRRYLAAFGPASRRDIGAWSMMHVPEIDVALA
jgi:hypothetical protein